MRGIQNWLSFCCVFLLTACGGGGGGDGGGSAARSDSPGRLNIAITDAPVDSVTDVVVEFAGVILRPVGTDEDCVVSEPEPVPDVGTGSPNPGPQDPAPDNPDQDPQRPVGGGLDDDDDDRRGFDDDDDDFGFGNDELWELAKDIWEDAKDRWRDARGDWLDAREEWLEEQEDWEGDEAEWQAARDRWQAANAKWRAAWDEWLAARDRWDDDYDARYNLTVNASNTVSASNVESDFAQCERGFDGELTFTFDVPRSINLVQLTDGKTEVLFDELVPAGSYSWIELIVNAESDGIFDSYVIEDAGAQVELRIPPERLRLEGDFTVENGVDSGLVIDWNLRMGLLAPVTPGDPYTLNPVLRLANTVEAGSIVGTVAASLLPPSNPVCTSDPNTGAGNVVYIFEGANVVPDDIDGNAVEPLVTADVEFNGQTGNYEFAAPFMQPGDYTVAFTCQAQDDLPPNPDFPLLIVNDPIVFSAVANATVEQNAGAQVALGP